MVKELFSCCTAAPEPDIIPTLWIKEVQGPLKHTVSLAEEGKMQLHISNQEFLSPMLHPQELRCNTENLDFPTAACSQALAFGGCSCATALSHTTQHQWEQRKNGR